MHNCLTCDINHKKEPGDNKTQNCITECAYYYYYSLYGQYKCTNNSICPEEANLYIKNIKKCTDDCNKEDIYKYQYGGQCLSDCPKNTSPNNKNICIDDNNNLCSKSENEIELKEFLTNGGVDLNAKKYANIHNL